MNSILSAILDQVKAKNPFEHGSSSLIADHQEGEVNLFAELIDNANLLPKLTENTILLPEPNNNANLLPKLTENTILLPEPNNNANLLPKLTENTILLSEPNNSANLLPKLTENTILLPEPNNNTKLNNYGNLLPKLEPVSSQKLIIDDHAKSDFVLTDTQILEQDSSKIINPHIEIAELFNNRSFVQNQLVNSNVVDHRPVQIEIPIQELHDNILSQSNRNYLLETIQQTELLPLSADNIAIKDDIESRDFSQIITKQAAIIQNNTPDAIIENIFKNPLATNILLESSDNMSNDSAIEAVEQEKALSDAMDLFSDTQDHLEILPKNLEKPITKIEEDKTKSVDIKVKKDDKKPVESISNTNNYLESQLEVKLEPNKINNLDSLQVENSYYKQPDATEQIKIQIFKALNEGTRQINLQLHPVELGRVDIYLELQNKGKNSINISVENPNTLELLQHDIRNLEKVLSEIGIKSESTDLNFSLSNNNNNHNKQGEQQEIISFQQESFLMNRKHYQLSQHQIESIKSHTEHYLGYLMQTDRLDITI